MLCNVGGDCYKGFQIECFLVDGAGVHLGTFPSVHNWAIVVAQKLQNDMFLSRLRVSSLICLWKEACFLLVDFAILSS
jgi:hypothetical protein